MKLTQSLPQAYCPLCQKDVEIFVILDQGDEVVSCTFCGSRLRMDIKKAHVDKVRTEKKIEAPAAPQGGNALLDEIAAALDVEPEEPLEEIEADLYYDGALGTVLIADDERLVRDVIADIFLDQGVAKEVVHCANGGEMVKKYSEVLARPDAPMGLLVVDLEMPVLNGLQTGMAIRKLEEQRELMPVPMLFFSGRKREARLDEAMKRLRPSMYMYKGEGAAGMSAEAALRQRVRKVVNLLMQEMTG